jgi:4,5-DOPA dioxygenase extradiol
MSLLRVASISLASLVGIVVGVLLDSIYLNPIVYIRAEQDLKQPKRRKYPPQVNLFNKQELVHKNAQLKTSNAPNQTKLPVIYFSHGAPWTLFDKNDEAGLWMRKFGLEYLHPLQPKSILIMSAHFKSEKKHFLISNNPAPKTDPESYKACFPHYGAPGNKELAETICQMLNDGGLDCNLNQQHGYDHGMWVLLEQLFPEENIPVIMLSVANYANINILKHFELGKILEPLREQGVLIIGSGSLTHNLDRYRRSYFDLEEMELEEWNIGFDEWVTDIVTNKNVTERNEALLNFAKHPFTKHAHPNGNYEHFLPLLMVIGASSANHSDENKGKKIYSGFCDHLSMSAFEFHM